MSPRTEHHGARREPVTRSSMRAALLAAALLASTTGACQGLDQLVALFLFFVAAFCGIVFMGIALALLLLRGTPSRAWGIAGLLLGLGMVAFGIHFLVYTGFDHPNKSPTWFVSLPLGALYSLLGWLNLRRKSGTQDVHS